MDGHNITVQLENIDLEGSDKEQGRAMCTVCERPKKVCYCCYLPRKRVRTKHRILVLQHPSEIKRSLRTAPILKLALDEECCSIIPCKRLPNTFSKDDRLESVRELISKKREPVVLMYPSRDAVSLTSLRESARDGPPMTVLLLDGTWLQARTMFTSSSLLQSLVKVRLDAPHCSEYVIRTQPADGCLSTLEAGALLLSSLEEDESIYEKLVQPLRALCAFQLEHGAEIHDSKISVPLNGIVSKQNMSRRCKRFFKALFVAEGETPHSESGVSSFENLPVV